VNIIQLADSVEAILAKKSPDGYEIMSGHSTTLSIEARDGKVDTFKSAEPVGVSIRLLKNKGMGFSYSSSFAPHDLEKMVDNALVGALAQSADETGLFPPKADYTPMPGLFDHGLEWVDISRKIGRAIELERLALAADSRIKRVRKATYGETVYAIHIRNSNGLFGSYEGTSVSSSLAALAEADGDSQMGWDFEYGTGFDSVSIERIAARAVSNSVGMLGARTIPTMRAPVVLDNHVAGDFLELLAPSFSAENLFKGKSLLKGKEGEKLFPSLLTVRDDGTLAGGMATSPFDGEGVPHRNVILVEGGVVRTYLYDTRYGARFGRPSSGNSARGGVKGMPHLGVSNFFIENGQTDPAGLMAGISRGMFITGLIGMHTANPVSGDFSVGATGFLIENGQLSTPVKGVAISGNVLDIFAGVESVGSDLRFFSTIGSPSLRISALDISGE